MSAAPRYRSILSSELERRKKKNPSYSLRAFSALLKMSPAQVSQVISGRRPLTAKSAARIADKLNFSPIERASFIESTLTRLDESPLNPTTELHEDEFRLIADWHHYAILSLSEVKGSRSDPRWIARTLGIAVSDAAEALARLERLGRIEIRNGKYRQLSGYVRTTSDIPSTAIRTNHKQNLERAKEVIDLVDVKDREFGSVTMAISRKNIPKAKELLRSFKRKLTATLENGEKDAVYTLAMQLFPVSKLEKK